MAVMTASSKPRNWPVRLLASTLGSLRATGDALAQNKVGLVAAWVLGVIVFVSLFAPFVIHESTPDVTQIYVAASLEHPLGTDYEGGDVLRQVLIGGQTVLIVGALAAALSVFISVTFGALSAYIGGWIEQLITGAADVVLTIPQYPLLAVLASYLRLQSPLMLAVLIGGLSWPVLLLAVRAQVLSLKQRDYVEAAHSLDLGTFHILFHEILPNMRSYIVMFFMFSIITAIYQQVGLYFLGFAPLAGHNWGIMLNFAWYRGAIFYKNSIWYIMAPVICISAVLLAMVMMQRSLEEAFNPRLRRNQ